MIDSQRHVLICRCILRQNRERRDPDKFRFTACSLIIDGECSVSYVECPNCGVTHKVIDLCRSEIVQSELTKLAPSLDELKASLPDKLCAILANHELDTSVWQHAVNIVTHKLWGYSIQLKRESVGTDSVVKYVQVLGESLFRVHTSVHPS